MVPAVLLLRDTPYLLAIGAIFGVLNFMRTWRFRQHTGVSPWHIHPVVWGIVSLFIAILGTVLAAVAMATTKPARARPGALPPPAAAPPGWHPDPSGRYQHRYWNGAAWTDHVATAGTVDIDRVAAPGPGGGPPGVTPEAPAAPLPPFWR